MKSLVTFLAYNNAVPILISAMFVGSAATFAATDVGQAVIAQTVVGRTETVVAVDNSYLLAKDFTTWSPVVTVTGVTEDATAYYVTYTLATINIDAYVWKDVVDERHMTVEKDILAKYATLAAYVQFQLKDVVVAERDRLARTQELQRAALTQKTTVVQYTGLVGAVLNAETIVADPYVPTPSTDVPAPPEQQAQAVVATQNVQQQIVADPALTVVMQVLGESSVHVPVGAPYVDLGALAHTGVGREVPVRMVVNGDAVPEGQQPHIDTTHAGVTTITYIAENAKGDRFTATRIVVVEDAAVQEAAAPVDVSPASAPADDVPAGVPSSDTAPTLQSQQVPSENTTPVPSESGTVLPVTDAPVVSPTIPSPDTNAVVQ